MFNIFLISIRLHIRLAPNRKYANPVENRTISRDQTNDLNFANLLIKVCNNLKYYMGDLIENS